MRHITVLVFTSCFMHACGGGPVMPKVSAITSFSDGVLRYTRQFDYDDDGHLTGTTLLGDDGVVSSTVTVTYSGDQIEELSATDWRVNLEYDGGRLSRVTKTTESEDIYDSEVRYDDEGRVVELNRRDGGAVIWVREYHYDGDGRLARTLRSSDGGTSVTRFRYDDEDLIERIEWTSGYCDLHYNDDDKLESIRDDDNDTHELRYNDDGLIRERIYGSSSASYEYQGGEVVGIIATPSMNFGEFFDMEGYRTDEVELLTFSFLLFDIDGT